MLIRRCWSELERKYIPIKRGGLRWSLFRNRDYVGAFSDPFFLFGVPLLRMCLSLMSSCKQGSIMHSWAGNLITETTVETKAGITEPVADTFF